jgi:PAS domain S-box-containing protein
MRILHILHLEDDPLDAELVEAHLREAGLEPHLTRVETRDDFLAALENGTFDLILADFSLPSFDGLTALRLFSERDRETPFLFLSGAIGEDRAIESLKRGATDYVLKQRMERLVPSIHRALREAEARAERRRAQAALRESEERLSRATKAAQLGTWDYYPRTGELRWDARCKALFGLPPDCEEVSYAVFLAGLHPDDRNRVERTVQLALDPAGDGEYDIEYRTVGIKDGIERWVRATGEVLFGEVGGERRAVRFIGTILDITDRKQAEAEILELNARLQRAMAESDHRIKNNLQILASFVDMQRMNSGATVPVSELERLSQHIHTLASLHDQLTLDTKLGAESLDAISLKTALEKLAPMLQTTAGGRTIVLCVEEARLPLKQAGPFSMLVNELVSNAIKHGRGTIEVALAVVREAGDAENRPRARLTVSDDGPGFPPDFDPRTAANTGLELIESMGRLDLNGSVTFENRPEGGARVLVLFPIEPT